MKSASSEQATAPKKQPQAPADTLQTTSVRDSAALRRLMEEVRYENTTGSAAIGYDRVHNRHNR